MTNPPFYYFCRAVAFGALAAGGVWLIATIPLGVIVAMDGEFTDGMLLAILPLLFSGGGTLAGMILIGLPATVIIAEHPPERAATYIKVGMTTGLIVPPILAVIASGEPLLPAAFGGGFLGLFGAAAGATAGSIWGDWRESLAIKEPQPAPTNPIHDLLF